MPSKTMMINRVRKYKYYHFLAIALLIFLIPVIIYGLKTDRTIKSKIISLDEGYGYEIEVNNKVFIHQEYMPGVKGYKLFESKEEAQKVADIVIKKLNNNESPKVCTEELIKAGLIQR